MGIREITVSEVSCQKCEATILVRNWWDARDHGWAAPSYGGLQLCPTCLQRHIDMLMATALTPEQIRLQEAEKRAAGERP